VAKGNARIESSGEDSSFGARLKRLREAAGLTQEELAGRAGLTAKAISLLERGERRHPYPHTVRALADALGLSEAERIALIAAIPSRSGDVPFTGGAAARPYAPPVSLTPLVGRDREVEEVAGLLARGNARLLTLTGAGGIGKTRLGIEASRRAQETFPDGVAFVALAPLGGADLVMPTALQALGLRGAAGVPPLEVLCQYLGPRKYLLVLDNFEHVLEAAPEVADLLSNCPDLRVLATSRAPLRVRDEREYPISPLAMPDPDRTPEANEVSRAPAARLFVERASEASPGFSLTPTNAAAVASICWRLEGLPLALELAAARARYLGPTALLSRLDQALQAGGARDLPERQRTMRSTLDWSHDLLSGAEKDLFARLSVFSGGFTLEAAEAVGAGGGIPKEEVLGLLGSLVEQSLILAESGEGGDELRYRMLEPVRQYALEKLEDGGQTRRLHARYFLALAEEAESRVKGPEQVAWLDRLEAENDNLRTAIGGSLAARDVQTAARFGWALRMYWLLRARQGEGRLLIEQTLERAEELPAQTRARALNALAVCMYGSGDAERLVEISEESAALFRWAGDAHGAAHAPGMIGFAMLEMGDLDGATTIFGEVLENLKEHEDAWTSAHILNHMAVAPLRRGDYPRAAEHAQEALALTEKTGDRLAAQTALQILAQAAWASGERQEASRYFRASLWVASELADRVNAAYCMQGLAAVVEPRRAARLLGAAEALLEEAAVPLYAWADHEMQQKAANAAHEQLGQQAWEAAHDAGRAMTFEEAVAYALGREAPPL
jgi:predicted ATPase/transcriptional regulator with XRE-family HTH domain